MGMIKKQVKTSKKEKVRYYILQYPIHWTVQKLKLFTIHSLKDLFIPVPTTVE